MNLKKFHFSSLNTHDIFELMYTRQAINMLRGLFNDEWQDFLITNNHNVRFVL